MKVRRVSLELMNTCSDTFERVILLLFSYSYKAEFYKITMHC